MKNISQSLLLLICGSLIFISSCKKLRSFDPLSDKTDVYSIISDDPNTYSLFKYIIDRAGMADEIKNGGYTVFAPTNAAFTASGYTTTNLQNVPLDSIALLVKNHLVDGTFDINSVAKQQQLTTKSNTQITIQKIGSNYYADGDDITNQSKHVNSGGLLTINKLLFKTTSIYERIFKYYNATSNNQFSMLLAAIDKASQGSVNYKQLLSDPNANYTFFAPTNIAFIKGGYTTVAAVTAANANILGAILANQLVQGKKLTTELDTTQAITTTGNVTVYTDKIYQTNRYTYCYINGVVTGGGSANMQAGAGCVHAVPRFMPTPINSTTLAKIQADPTLTFFYKALQVGTQAGKYDFIKMLSDNSTTYTVFAINNTGFQNAGYTTLQNISDASPAAISDMLLFHIANKRLNGGNYDDNGGMSTLYLQQNLNGTKTIANITVSNTPSYNVKGPTNQAAFTVSGPNTVTTNGLLNVIGGVLTP